MPIIERTAQACIHRFRALIAELVASTIGGTHVVRCTAVPEAGPTTATISFVQGEDPIAVPVQAKKLKVTFQFFFGQTVEAVKIKDGKGGHSTFLDRIGGRKSRKSRMSPFSFQKHLRSMSTAGLEEPGRQTQGRAVIAEAINYEDRITMYA